MNVYTALSGVQKELKAPKDRYNSFGKYSYRSCEGILEAVKPILVKWEANLVLTDSVENVGDRNYVKATAIFRTDEGEIKSTAYAREDPVKKGMDGSQITGTASSYARKYALNGLFLIDDTKDADADENKTECEARQKAAKSNLISAKQVTVLQNMAKRHAMPETEIYERFNKKSLAEMTLNDWTEWSKIGQNVLNEWDTKHGKQSTSS